MLFRSVPYDCRGAAIVAVQSIAKFNRTVEKSLRTNIDDAIRRCVAQPEDFSGDTHLGELSRLIIEDRAFVRPEPVDYKTWGDENIDPASHTQMKQACALPMATGAALMPDAHVGYGLPIGGVLALENAVVPYAVGVDIACRMKLTVYDVAPLEMRKRHNIFADALEKGTVFGVGKEHKKSQEHEVMDQAWTVSRITRQRKEKAHKQLAT